MTALTDTEKPTEQTAPTTHQGIAAWVAEIAELTGVKESDEFDELKARRDARRSG